MKRFIQAVMSCVIISLASPSLMAQENRDNSETTESVLTTMAASLSFVIKVVDSPCGLAALSIDCDPPRSGNPCDVEGGLGTCNPINRDRNNP